MLYLKHLDINKVTVEGINCESIAHISSWHGNISSVQINNYTNPNFAGTKIYGLDNLYYSNNFSHQDVSAIIVGEDETSLYILNIGTPTLQKVDKDKLANLVMLEDKEGINSFDYTIYLKDVEGTNNYKIVVEAGYGYEDYGSVGERVVEFDTLLDKSYKKFGFLWIGQDLVGSRDMIHIYEAYKEDEIGMKIDTILDKSHYTSVMEIRRN